MALTNPEQAEAVDWMATEHEAAVLNAKAQRENIESMSAHNAASVRLMEAKAALRQTLGALAIILGVGWSIYGWVRIH